jgi:hypothetical protein
VLSCCVKFSNSISSGTFLITPFLITIYLGMYAVSLYFWITGLSKTLMCFHSF